MSFEGLTDPPPPPKPFEAIVPKYPDNKVIAFYYKEFVQFYKDKGVHDPKWDQKAVDALWKLSLKYAESKKQGGSKIPLPEKIDSQILFNDFSHLVKKLRCKDPLIHYGYSYMAAEVKAFDARHLFKLDIMLTRVHS